MTTKTVTLKSFGEGPLYWGDRPPELLSRIQDAFQTLETSTHVCWKYNGTRAQAYKLCDIDEYALMKKIIQQSSQNQRDFYALDIGAGNFGWSFGLAEFLDRQTDLPEGIKVHIIGIRGEKNLGDKVIETARCKIYNQGACKIEEIAEQLKSFENRIDLAVSSWTFRHLVDPVGTFLQTYQLLRPETGLLLMDGFFFSYSGEEWQKTDHDQQITELFLETQAPFLMRQQHDDGAFNHFIVRRPDNLRCRLPMRYGGLQEIRIKSAASRCVTEFQRCSPPKDQPVIHWDACTLFGDKSLYEWLQVNALLEYGNWQILQER